MSPLHQMARAYAEARIPVFPCEAGGKRPVTENGFHDATTDTTIIDKWWQQNPNYNLAICPEDIGWFVIDVDPGADLEILKRLPASYTVRTPRGGYHIYFEGSGRTSASKLAPHVDTRGVSGYVLVPPSLVDGKAYEVERDIDYAPIPDWISTELATGNTPRKAAVNVEDLSVNILRARTLLEGYVKRGDVAIQSCGGDDRTYRLCCELLDLGLSIPTAKDLLEEIWNPHCVPSWDSSELDIKFQNASNYQQNEPGADAVGSSEDAFGEAAAKLGQAEQKEEAERPFVYIRDRETQLNSPPAEMQIEKILPHKKSVLPWGGTDAGKTYWGLEVATAIAMERPAFGQFKILKPGPALIFAGEDSDRLEQSRLTAIETHYKRSLQGLVYTVETAIPLDDTSLFEKYCDEIRRMEKYAGVRFAVMMNDTLKRSLGTLNPNDADVGMHFTAVMEKLVVEFGCTILCNAHQPKSGAEHGISGTGSFMDNASITPHLIRSSEKPFDIQCEFEPKFRCGPRPESFTVRGQLVLLPKSVAGVTHDLIFTALTPDQVKRIADHSEAFRAEYKELQRVLDLFGAHSIATGLTTKRLAEELAGDPKRYEDDDAYRQTVGKHYNRLDNGTRGKKQRNGKQSRPKFEAWFEKDRRDNSKGVTKWFCSSPEQRAAAQETGTPCT